MVRGSPREANCGELWRRRQRHAHISRRAANHFDQKQSVSGLDIALCAVIDRQHAFSSGPTSTFAEVKRPATVSGVPVLTEEVLREEPGITQNAFGRLLAWLDGGVDSGGETYLEIRRRLVGYFNRRHRPLAEDLADETLNRVGRTLEQQGAISVTPPARYCYVVARFILLEDLRRERRQVPVDDARMAAPHMDLADIGEPASAHEERLRRLDICLDKLKPEQREIVVDYYRDVRRDRITRRRRLAERLGITMNALSIRAWRIRTTLENCLRQRAERNV
jgi:DNA-directed RNA polymerase specialized sigma24 family protein